MSEYWQRRVSDTLLKCFLSKSTKTELAGCVHCGKEPAEGAEPGPEAAAWKMCACVWCEQKECILGEHWRGLPCGPEDVSLSLVSDLLLSSVICRILPSPWPRELSWDGKSWRCGQLCFGCHGDRGVSISDIQWKGLVQGCPAYLMVQTFFFFSRFFYLFEIQS